MKKTISSVFVALILAICVFLAAGFAVKGPSAGGSNEVLASKPKMSIDILEDTADYYSDRFFLRQELISARNKMLSVLFGVSGEESVILGKNGWLYYADTLGCYTGTDGMSENEILRAAKNLSLMNEYCQSSGVNFLFTVAPNKNSLYYNNMPNYGATNSEKDAQKLFALLSENGTPYLDLFTLFENEEETLYYAHDSHWTGKGAALAADAINEALNVETCYYNGDFSNAERHDGDLFTMLYPAFTDDETEMKYSGNLSFDYTSKATAADSINLTTESSGSGSILCYRDSFGNNLYPYLAATYANAKFSRSVSYNLTELDNVDNVVIELVERNLAYLIKNIPQMPAPERNISSVKYASGIYTSGTETVEAGATGTVTLSESESKVENCVFLQGTLDENAEEVYLFCGGKAYEAFLLADGGFAASVPGVAESVAAVIDGEAVFYSAAY